MKIQAMLFASLGILHTINISEGAKIRPKQRLIGMCVCDDIPCTSGQNISEELRSTNSFCVSQCCTCNCDKFNQDECKSYCRNGASSHCESACCQCHKDGK